jgi:DNA-binding HxlR family transcriptional regulator
VALPAYDGGSGTGDEFLDALGLLTRGQHAAVLRAIGEGNASMPAIREATSFEIDEPSLISMLKALMNCGAVARSVHAGPPLRVDYRLTEGGRTLAELIARAQAWSARWAAEPPQTRLDPG